MGITWILNLLMTLAIILMRSPIAAIYQFDGNTTELLMKSLLVYAVALTPKMPQPPSSATILREMLLASVRSSGFMARGCQDSR